MHHSVTQILQLEARSASRSDKYICADLDRLQRLRKSLNREVHTAHQGTEGNSSASNPSLAITTMVCSTSPAVPGPAEDNPGIAGSNSGFPGDRIAFSRQIAPAGRMACLRRHYSLQGLSTRAISLLLSSWRDSTNKNYDSSSNIWERWCSDHHRDSLSPSIGGILDFLAVQFDKGREYRSLNCYRSALSSVLGGVDGFPVGSDPLVCRALKGAFQLRPPKPKYSSFWSVDQVLSHSKLWGPNESLSLQKLTWKLAMLIALCSAGRSSDLSHLSVNKIRFHSRR